MYIPYGQEALIPLEWTKQIAIAIMAVIGVSVAINLSAIWCIYNRRNMRSSSTAIMVANLACVDILVTFKDFPMFYQVSLTGKWAFEESWCSTYGLTNVIFIIVSVSTLVTITTERFTKLKELAMPKLYNQTAGQRPVVLGYVIAHTTLSYSLSLLWSKYVFVTRKAFCRVEWPPRRGFSLTFLSSFIFIVPVSFLIYNLLFKNVFKEENGSEKSNPDCASDDIGKMYEAKAQHQLHITACIFLLSWTPYVAESVISGYMPVTPLAGIITACIPLLTTSLLPFIYVHFFRIEPVAITPPKYSDVIVQ